MDFENRWGDPGVKHPFEQVIVHDYFVHHAVHPEKTSLAEMDFYGDWYHDDPVMHFEICPFISEK